MTATETPPSILIPRVVARLIVNDAHFGPVFAHLDTDNAADAFRRLEEAATKREHVDDLEIDGRAIDAESLAALNAYLRTPRALNWNGVLPFSRIVRHRSRWSWQMFLAYLDVTFSP